MPTARHLLPVAAKMGAATMTPCTQHGHEAEGRKALGVQSQALACAKQMHWLQLLLGIPCNAAHSMITSRLVAVCVHQHHGQSTLRG